MIDSALVLRDDVSSLTFFDDEAIKLPGKTWEYAIKTKFKGVTKISDQDHSLLLFTQCSRVK